VSLSTRLAIAVGVATVIGMACGYTYREGTFFPATWKSEYVKIGSCVKTEHPAGGWVQVYMDAAGAKAFGAGANPLPEGTVIVKAQYKSAGCAQDFDLWTAMRKGKPGTSKPGRDWLWQTIWDSGKIHFSGVNPDCINCHDACGGKDTDFICTGREAQPSGVGGETNTW
jgi:hypothetical protein